MRLNGWQRLWVVVALMWTIAVGVRTWNTWPTPYLSVDPNAGIPHGADVTYLMNGIINKDETLTRVQFAARLKAKYPEYADLSDEELVARTLEKYPHYSNFIETTEGFLPDPPQIVEALNRSNRNEAIRFGLMLWLVPPITLYVFGYLLCWVYRGFRTT